MRFIFCLVAALCCAAIAPCAGAAEFHCISSRADLFKPCPRLNPDNGHYYAMGAPKAETWDEARAAAESFVFKGVHGHLVTITSAEENDFLSRNFNPLSLWIGASDAEVNGEWRWVVGPEAGELFWLGGADGQAFGYANWADGEPNDLFTPEPLENHAEFNTVYSRDGHGKWNDFISGYQPQAYLVEFSVPEPSSYALLMIGGAALALNARRRRHRR